MKKQITSVVSTADAAGCSSVASTSSKLNPSSSLLFAIFFFYCWSIWNKNKLINQQTQIDKLTAQRKKFNWKLFSIVRSNWALLHVFHSFLLFLFSFAHYIFIANIPILQMISSFYFFYCFFFISHSVSNIVGKLFHDFAHSF